MTNESCLSEDIHLCQILFCIDLWQFCHPFCLHKTSRNCTKSLSSHLAVSLFELSEVWDIGPKSKLCRKKPMINLSRILLELYCTSILFPINERMHQYKYCFIGIGYFGKWKVKAKGITKLLQHFPSDSYYICSFFQDCQCWGKIRFLCMEIRKLVFVLIVSKRGLV